MFWGSSFLIFQKLIRDHLERERENKDRRGDPDLHTHTHVDIRQTEDGALVKQKRRNTYTMTVNLQEEEKKEKGVKVVLEHIQHRGSNKTKTERTKLRKKERGAQKVGNMEGKERGGSLLFLCLLLLVLFFPITSKMRARTEKGKYLTVITSGLGNK